MVGRPWPYLAIKSPISGEVWQSDAWPSLFPTNLRLWRAPLAVVDLVPPVPLLPDAGARAFVLVEELGYIVRALRSRYPNLRLVFLSNMVYGGFLGEAHPLLEPFLYENGFAMKWLIEPRPTMTMSSLRCKPALR